MERHEYVDRVVKRLQALLDAETRLPCGFTIAGGWAAQTDGPIYIDVKPETVYEKVFEGSEIFSDMQQRLNDEFGTNPWYFGILIRVPNLFLSERRHEELRQQEVDNEKNRRTWLHGRRKRRKRGPS